NTEIQHAASPFLRFEVVVTELQERGTAKLTSCLPDGLSDSRTERREGAVPGSWRSSQPELLRDLGRPDRCAYLREGPMHLAELVLPGRFLAGKPRQLGHARRGGWRVALRPRHLEPRLGFGERCFDVSLAASRPRISRRARIRVSRA